MPRPILAGILAVTVMATGSMLDARTSFSATPLANRQVLVAGGVSATLPLSSADVFTPGT